MKILYVTTIGRTMGFFKSFVKELIDKGHTVDIATNESRSSVPDCYREWGCQVYPISCQRSPLSFGNFKAIGEIKKIVKDGGYELVHCHTPIAAACTRLACNSLRKNGVKVIYTAHGFHFYKGAPFMNWALFYPVEKLCSGMTDKIITINQEDYALACEKFKNTSVAYVPGVGIDTDKFANATVDQEAKRDEIGVPSDAFLLLSVGELNKNKNHEVVLRALAKLGDKSIHYAIAGKGNLDKHLLELAEELGISDNFHLLGYRTDVAELYKVADVYLLPSFREGLNVSIMESLAAGLPVICSNIRGNCDMVKDGENGYLADPFKPDSFVEAITRARECRLPTNADIFNRDKINAEMMSIYSEVTGVKFAEGVLQ